MNKNIRGSMIAFVFVGVILIVAYYAPDFLPAPPITPTGLSASAIIPTFTVNPFSVAHINIDSPCRSGTNEKHDVITTIPQGKDVWLIGKDSELPDWLFVRWGAFPDCWVEKKYLITNDINLVTIVPTPPAQTSTSIYTLTFTPTPTFTSTPTKTFMSITPSRTRNPFNNSKTPTPTNTSPIPTPTNTSPAPTPTNTSPAPTPTNTSPAPTPTNTSPAPTPTNTPKPTATLCLNPQGKPIPCH